MYKYNKIKRYCKDKSEDLTLSDEVRKVYRDVYQECLDIEDDEMDVYDY